MDWHKDLPPKTEQVWDIVAKAMLLKSGGSVVVTEAEMKTAAVTPCEIAIDSTGMFHFRIEHN